jgi:hypothetical protein
MEIMMRPTNAAINARSILVGRGMIRMVLLLFSMVRSPWLFARVLIALMRAPIVSDPRAAPRKAELI